MQACPCLARAAPDAAAEDRVAPAGPSDSAAMTVKASGSGTQAAPKPQAAPERPRESSFGSKGDDENENEEEEEEDSEAGLLDGLTYDALRDMAVDLWRTATQYLQPAEAQEFNAAHDREMQRMNTLQLREHVSAGRSAQTAVDALVSSGETTTADVAAAQRSSMHVLDGSVRFDGDLFAQLLRESRARGDGQVSGEPFLAASNMVPLLMGGLGRTFEFALADLNKKLETAALRLQETAEDLEQPLRDTSLQEMVLRDVRLGVTHAGKKAAPASRTLLRLMWFLDFVGALLLRCGERQGDDLKSICAHVYNETLAPRHAWLIRKAATSGMRLVPKKEVFRVRLGTQALTPAQEKKKLLGWAKEVQETADVLWDFMKAQGLEELP